MQTLIRSSLPILFGVFTAVAAAADPITLKATDFGFFFGGCKTLGCPAPDAGRKGPPGSLIGGYFSDQKTALGPGFLAGEYRDYFVFDLSSVVGDIVSAQLRVENSLPEGSARPFWLYDASRPSRNC